MRRKFMKVAAAFCAVFLMGAILLPEVLASGAQTENQIIRVGLAYSNGALPFAGLENEVGNGFQLGYFNTDYELIPLAQTDERQITMLKTQNLYLSNGTYYTAPPSGSYTTIGCYHVELPGSYPDFASAKQAASQTEGGFPAYIMGNFVVRVGAYGTKAEAEARQAELGISGTSVKGTSTNGVSVVKTGTADILLQFDGGSDCSLGVLPSTEGGQKAVTGFQGNRYYGGFQFQRFSGNLNVVNFVDLEDYIKGVLPYEMSASWPIEALKAQAICARNYATLNRGKHSAYGFDMCSNVDCQTYYGLGRADENTDRAVDETAGEYLRYQNELAETFYFSSDGGATEDVYNVWGSNYPYLKGVEDPYEALVADRISNYEWSTTFTADELTERLNSKGYDCGKIVKFEVTSRSALGNVTAITFTDEAGQTVYLTRERVRTVLNLRSQRYQVFTDGQASSGSGDQSYVITGGSTVSGINGLYAISGSGTLGTVTEETPYAATGSGVEALTGTGAAGDGGSGSTFTITGTGWGHHVGMSQWGAYAMAQQGLNYKDILTFYFTGTTVG